MGADDASARGGAACDCCEGTGVLEEENIRKCHNCDGVGSCAAGSGNRFVCTLCNGEGETAVRKEVKCKQCGGTGQQAKVTPKVVGRAADRAPGGPAAGSSASSSTGPRAAGRGRGAAVERGEAEEEEEVLAEASGDEEEAKPRAKAAAKKAGKSAVPAPTTTKSSAKEARPVADAGRSDEVEPSRAIRQFRWEPDEGFVIDVTLRKTWLMNALGTVLLVIGLILMLQQMVAWWVIGAVLAALGLGFLFRANIHRCPSLQTLQDNFAGAGTTSAAGARV